MMKRTLNIVVFFLAMFSITEIMSTVVPKKGISEENCVMSFVIPKDKVKSSCQIEERVNRRLNSMEVKLNMYRREVTSLQSVLQRERQLCHDKVQALERKMAMFDSDSRYYTLEKKLENLEVVLKKRTETVEVESEGKYIRGGRADNRAKSGSKKNDLSAENLTCIVKPIVISEIENYLENFTRVADEKANKNNVESNKIMNLWPPNDQSYRDDGNVKVNVSQTRSMIKELEKLQDKMNKTGDELVATVGSLLKNVTVRGDSMYLKQNKTVESGSENNSTLSVNSTEAVNHKIQPKKGEISRKKDKSYSRISQFEGGKEPQNDQEHENGKLYVTNLYTKELEEILRAEINNLLQSRMEEVISLMRKQSSNFVNTISQHGEEIDKMEESMEERMKWLQDKVEGITLQMTSLSSTVQELYGKLDKMQTLQVIVEELKKNMTTGASSNSKKMVIKVDEHGKKLRTLDRLYGIFQQSLQHYRNESKVAYTNMQSRLGSLETSLARDVTSDLYTNITAKVGQDFQRFNNTLRSKMSSMEAAIQNLEDNSVLYQMDIKILERRHKSKTGKLEEDYGSLRNRVDRINSQNRKLQEGVSSLRADRKHFLMRLNSTSTTLKNLKMDFELDVTDSWVEHNFQYDTSRTECFGKQYVRKTNYRNGRLVGVVLCSNRRYKILLANLITDKFSNVGDGAGFGEDHCEFVGARQSSMVHLSPPAISMKTEEGFARDNWGQVPRRVRLNFLRPTPAWYECGVRIP